MKIAVHSTKGWCTSTTIALTSIKQMLTSIYLIRRATQQDQSVIQAHKEWERFCDLDNVIGESRNLTCIYFQTWTKVKSNVGVASYCTRVDNCLIIPLKIALSRKNLYFTPFLQPNFSMLIVDFADGMWCGGYRAFKNILDWLLRYTCACKNQYFEICVC